jgi:hypothetical protein
MRTWAMAGERLPKASATDLEVFFLSRKTHDTGRDNTTRVADDGL